MGWTRRAAIEVDVKSRESGRKLLSDRTDCQRNLGKLPSNSDARFPVNFPGPLEGIAKQYGQGKMS
jgi:hypothetical protein